MKSIKDNVLFTGIALARSATFSANVPRTTAIYKERNQIDGSANKLAICLK